MKKNIKTDRDWEKYGNSDPYYGVVTKDMFKTENLTKENKKIFFDTGENYIENVLKNVKKYVDNSFVPDRALDFGCGVGRLLIPLARRAKFILGLDTSQSMLDETKKNCESFDIKNYGLLKSDSTLSNLTGKFNLINSFIVFQHIPAKYGEKIFEKLLEHLEGQGVGIFHFTYFVSYSKSLIHKAKAKFPLTHNISNMIMGRPFRSPRMQMNEYNLNRLFYLIQKHNIKECHTEFTDHKGALGIIIYLKK